jgi:acyl-CoA thioester hydrolase
MTSGSDVGATITIERQLDWIDTDAAGYWHHSTLWRFVEAAEAQLHRDLGIVDITFGFTPRRRVEAEFFAPLHFDRPAAITLEVARVGRTSATYEARMTSGDTLIATARIVMVFIDGDGRATPWPDAVAGALADGVPVEAAAP